MTCFVVLSLLGSVFRRHKIMKSHLSDEQFRRKSLSLVCSCLNHYHHGQLIMKVAWTDDEEA